MPAPKRLTIEISSELQLKLQTILPHNTKPTRKEIFTKIIEMFIEEIEEQGQTFIYKFLRGEIHFQDSTLYMKYTPGKKQPLAEEFIPKPIVHFPQVETPFGPRTKKG